MDLKSNNILENRVKNLHLEIVNSVPLYLKKIESISKEHNISSDLLIKELLKFFIIVEQNKMITSPSLIVDLAWHELILFTKFYHDFCEKNFNKFIHHTPSENENKEIFNNTINKYKQLFNNPPKEVWFRNNSIEWDNNECGSCNN